MDKIFGIPANNLATVMAVLLIVIFLVVSFGSIRRFILFKMGTRNIPRRKGQSLLIVIGLMLSSIIIATSLGIGDTVRYSIRSVAVDSLGPVDEVIEGPGKQLFGDEYFDYSEFIYVQNISKDNANIEQLIPYIQTTLPASNEDKDIAESSMNIRGIDFNFSVQKVYENLDGDNVSVDLLGPDQVFLNYDAGRILKLQKGDSIQIYTNEGPSNFIVADVLKSGGLIGGTTYPYVTFELSALQNLLSKENLITNIAVSNIGEGDESLEYSEDVTKFLRSNLTNQNVAKEVFSLLQTNEIPSILKNEAISIKETDNETSETLIELSDKLEKDIYDDDFITTITDYPTQLVLLGILQKSGLQQEAAKILKMSQELTRLRVDNIKSDGVRLAEAVSTGVTTIFSIFGSFSIMVGMLLIFLVFVLLAAARSTELGMARAVGLKRRDLIQLFTYEGTLYSFLAAIVGTLLGVGLSFGLVYILQDLIGTDNFQILPYYSPISLLIAFASGLILTFITVVFSAYRASNLNIVVAIRGLKDEFVKKAPNPFRVNLFEVLWNLIYPFKQLYLIITGKAPRFRSVLLMVIFPVSWPFSFVRSLFILFGKHSYLLLGVFSLILLLTGILNENYINIWFGSTGGVLALALLIRFISSKYINDPETVNQIGGTLEGGLVLLVNSLPLSFFESFTGELSQPGPWAWPIGGAISTAAAVWLLMSNTRVLIFILNLILSRFSGLKAVTKTAISYPMASKFRTGLTVAMFGLIIFTLMIFSVLNGIGDIASEQPERVTGGFDIKASVSSELPIQGQIEDSLNMDDYSSVFGSSSLNVEVAENIGDNKAFKTSRLISYEEDFMNITKWRMAHFDPKYGSTDVEIWQSLLENPNLIIASGSIIPSGDPFGPPDRTFKTSFIEPGDEKEIDAFDVKIRKRNSEEEEKFTVIGIVERLAEETGFGNSGAKFYTTYANGNKLAKETLPLNTYYFSLSGDKSPTDYAQKLEKTFLANGMNAYGLINRLEEEQATSNAFNKLFQGFSGLGLIVGVAAIGVLSVRAVVERRQSIGVLRAIGFRSSMIRTQFLIESSFITILGIVVGIFLGILQSWLIYNEISKELEGAKFVIPFGEVGILVGLTVIASILASVIPANEASKTYPAEALRYE
ncbi:MAG: FtsX-like permease family protein [Chloroflexota bacterium]|nr:FtsX-like permease family protein [Chloroflexota bacterium]